MGFPSDYFDDVDSNHTRHKRVRINEMGEYVYPSQTVSTERQSSRLRSTIGDRVIDFMSNNRSETDLTTYNRENNTINNDNNNDTHNNNINFENDTTDERNRMLLDPPPWTMSQETEDLLRNSAEAARRNRRNRNIRRNGLLRRTSSIRRRVPPPPPLSYTSLATRYNHFGNSIGVSSNNTDSSVNIPSTNFISRRLSNYIISDNSITTAPTDDDITNDNTNSDNTTHETDNHYNIEVHRPYRELNDAYNQMLSGFSNPTRLINNFNFVGSNSRNSNTENNNDSHTNNNDNDNNNTTDDGHTANYSSATENAPSRMRQQRFGWRNPVRPPIITSPRNEELTISERIRRRNEVTAQLETENQRRSMMPSTTEEDSRLRRSRLIRIFLRNLRTADDDFYTDRDNRNNNNNNDSDNSATTTLDNDNNVTNINRVITDSNDMVSLLRPLNRYAHNGNQGPEIDSDGTLTDSDPALDSLIQGGSSISVTDRLPQNVLSYKVISRSSIKKNSVNDDNNNNDNSDGNSASALDETDSSSPSHVISESFYDKLTAESMRKYGTTESLPSGVKFKKI
ncbi:hypothetical protein B5S32_g756 [[Candida] boidinii]|nr:hypothetical protein B5S32_g756 [[Candida] boidinii]